jgi:group I intron endonuclease
MIIYMTTNNINGKKYIGKDVKNNPKYLGSGFDLQKAIKKYGKENFTKIILETCPNKEELWKREEYWLTLYNAKSNPEFYNRTNKAYGAWENRKYAPLSIETKNKMARSHKNIPLSESHKKSISQSMKGHSKSEEWKSNLSKSSSDSFGRPVLQKDLEGNLIQEWNTAKEASNSLNINYTAINNCCRFNEKNISPKRSNNKLGRYTSSSYIWEYKKI